MSQFNTKTMILCQIHKIIPLEEFEIWFFLGLVEFFYPVMEVLEPRNLDHCSLVAFLYHSKKCFQKHQGQVAIKTYQEKMRAGNLQKITPPEICRSWENLAKVMLFLGKKGALCYQITENEITIWEFDVRFVYPNRTAWSWEFSLKSGGRHLEVWLVQVQPGWERTLCFCDNWRYLLSIIANY